MAVAVDVAVVVTEVEKEADEPDGCPLMVRMVAAGDDDDGASAIALADARVDEASAALGSVRIVSDGVNSRMFGSLS